MDKLDILKPMYFQIITERPHKIFKSIRLHKYFYAEDHKPVRAIAHLNYLRRIYNGYDYKQGDEFDVELLNNLNSISEECSLYINQPLFYENHQEYLVRQTTGNRIQDINVILFPHFEEASLLGLMGRSFISIPKQLHINVRLIGIQPGTMQYLIEDGITLPIPHEKVEQYANTVIAI